MPFSSGVMSKESTMLDTLPPWSPGFVTLVTPCTGIPSRHQLSRASGLLELESQVSVAIVPVFNSGGSFRITTWSGGTGIQRKLITLLLVYLYCGFKPIAPIILRSCVGSVKDVKFATGSQVKYRHCLSYTSSGSIRDSDTLRTLLRKKTCCLGVHNTQKQKQLHLF